MDKNRWICLTTLSQLRNLILSDDEPESDIFSLSVPKSWGMSSLEL